MVNLYPKTGLSSKYFLSRGVPRPKNRAYGAKWSSKYMLSRNLRKRKILYFRQIRKRSKPDKPDKKKKKKQPTLSPPKPVFRSGKKKSGLSPSTPPTKRVLDFNSPLPSWRKKKWGPKANPLMWKNTLHGPDDVPTPLWTEAHPAPRDVARARRVLHRTASAPMEDGFTTPRPVSPFEGPTLARKGWTQGALLEYAHTLN